MGFKDKEAVAKIRDGSFNTETNALPEVLPCSFILGLHDQGCRLSYMIMYKKCKKKIDYLPIIFYIFLYNRAKKKMSYNNVYHLSVS